MLLEPIGVLLWIAGWFWDHEPGSCVASDCHLGTEG